MDMVFPPYLEREPSAIIEAAAATPVGEAMRLRVAGQNDFGDPIEFVAQVTIAKDGTGRSGPDPARQ
jgi:hypothetical protein